MPSTAGAALVAARSPCKGECDCLLFGLSARSGTAGGGPLRRQSHVPVIIFPSASFSLPLEEQEEVLRGRGRFSFFWSHNSLHLPHPTPFALQNLTSYAPEPHFLSSQTYSSVSPNLPFSSAPDNQHLTEP